MKASIVIFLLSFLFNELYSQQNELISDSLITGKQYKIVLDNRWETECVLMNILDESLLIETGGKYITLRRNRIKSMTMIITDKVQSPVKEQNKVCNLYLNDGKKINKVKLEYVNSDTLYVLRGDKNISIPLFLINKIVINNESHSTLVALILGSLSGAIIGYAVTPENEWFKGTKTVGALSGIIMVGILGGVVGAMIDADDEYDFTSMDKETKVNEIKRLLEGLE